ncbi:cyclic nucleotide-binding domain-containing protein [Flavobacterium sp. Sd200]|uniref:Crp/Fnr family transcriptional regulator n=1 Tax=Flavobacterium sp. Sd200 TaxID=2692211 RepID=UPI00136BB1AD|nr:Crp/Fnr family transcriptional regulator [Flavobacterium sp. Sd200]MXN92083.1 cyclic nucleotide-binding domain-containing protein [Flavobacterium sp. Sd200]
MEQLIAHIQKHVTLNDADKALLTCSLSIQKINKKEFLLKAGHVCKSYYFVTKGCLRMYIVNAKGVEQMIQFGIDNWWLTDYMSLNSKQPSQFCMQAVEDTEFIEVERTVQEELLQKIPQLERYFRLVSEKSYAASLMRIHYIFSFSKEERYRHFNNLYPDFVQRVPQYLLASYLGFTPEFLSKIRAKK